MNYQKSSIEDLTEHFIKLSPQAITQRLMYYKNKGDEETVGKIRKARILAKQKKLLSEMESIKDA